MIYDYPPDDENYMLNPFKSSKDETDFKQSFFWVEMNLYAEKFLESERNIKTDKDEMLKLILANVNTIGDAERFVQKIMQHYHEKEIPMEDNLAESLDTENFPDNKELKRYFEANETSHTVYDKIDIYSDTQPTEENKKTELKKLHEYFKMLKAHVHDYYPQLKKLPSRGFRELERTIYTINYLFVIELNEIKNQILGIETNFKKRKQKINKARDEYFKKKQEEREKNKDEGWLEMYNKMTDEEKQKEEDRINAIIETEEREEIFIDTAAEFAGALFVKMHPEFNFNTDDFIVKTRKICSITFSDGFYYIEKLFDHYSISSDHYVSDKDIERKKNGKNIEKYIKVKKELGDEFHFKSFLAGMDDFDKGRTEHAIKRYRTKKAILKAITKCFPRITELPGRALIEADYYAGIVARVAIKEMYEVRDRLLGVDCEALKEWDKKIEKIKRDKYK